jgi:hypothetical protein
MNQYYLGNTLINDAYIGSIRVADLIVSSSTLNIDYLVIGGGGAGGGNFFTASGPTGGGGGAGGLLSGSISITKTNTTYTAIVGAAGLGLGTVRANGPNGSPSSLIGGLINVVTVGGGGGGGYALNGSDGGCGGGGGGATPGFTSGGTGSAGPPRQGFNGAPDYDVIPNTGGGGGGTAAAATTNIGASGSVWLDGFEYGRGGDARGSLQASGSGGGGPAIAGGQGQNGNPGTIIIRYPGSGSKATGGAITFVDGYTYHRFLFPNGGTGSFTY